MINISARCGNTVWPKLEKKEKLSCLPFNLDYVACPRIPGITGGNPPLVLKGELEMRSLPLAEVWVNLLVVLETLQPAWGFYGNGLVKEMHGKGVKTGDYVLWSMAVLAGFLPAVVLSGGTKRGRCW